MATVFRPPIIQSIKRRSQLVDLWYGGNNLLGTTLVPVAADPFFMLDWPTPQRRMRFVDSQLGNNLLETTLSSGANLFAGMTMFRDSRQR